MNRLIQAVSISLTAFGISQVQSIGQTETALTPAQQYAALLNEYHPASGALRSATTDWERRQAAKNLGTYPSKFLDLAERYPGDPDVLKVMRQAIQALGSTDSAIQIAWETNRSNFPAPPDEDDSAARTVALLMRDHLDSDAIGPVLDRLRYSYRLETEGFLRAVLERSPHREMQGAACLYLARYLNDRLHMVRLAADRPELAVRYESVFGSDYLPQLQKMERDGLAANIEALLERAEADFADVKAIRGGTVGEQAKSDLYELRHLAVGLTAPDIVGRDQDGIEFKLSHYRGKVLLLYFWMEY